MDDLPVRTGIVIPAAALVERFETSGGPGGQHANRNETRVELSVDLRTCGGLTDEQRTRALGNAPDPVVRVSIAESRSQWRNRKIARDRIAALLNEYLAPPPPPRRATRPSRGARERRIAEKKQRAQTKRSRRRPDAE
jgi:ribosome-associated protein